MMEHKPDETAQQCPICSTPVQSSQRYPTYICAACTPRAVDEKGLRVKFSNTGLLGGGIQMIFVDHPRKKQKFPKKDEYWLCCYIDGKKCIAHEAHFGGIVISLCKE